MARTSGRPPVLENSLYYEGNYYVIGGSRMTVNEDKTENDNYFILTLAAIAKELKTRGIEKFAKVVLGVGVPFKRFGEEQANLVDYLIRSGLIPVFFNGTETEELCWDNESTVETVILMTNSGSKGNEADQPLYVVVLE